MDQPTAQTALRRLDVLVGDWDLTATGADGEQWPGGGSMSFAWHESGQLLVQTSSVDLPEAPATVAVIGCDGADGTYTQLYTDDRGVCRVYAMTMGDGGWTLERHGEPFAQRWVATVTGDVIEGRWHRDDDGTGWVTDFDLVLRRR